jgi:hypothetical protein
MTTNWPEGFEITPREIAAGAVELTVVDPIVKVVLVVDEYRHKVTALFATGQCENFARLGGSAPACAAAVTGARVMMTRIAAPTSAISPIPTFPQRARLAPFLSDKDMSHLPSEPAARGVPDTTGK